MSIRIGILAASRIAESALVVPAAITDGVEVVAVAARSRARAEEAARRWGVPTAYAGYDDLYAAADVDAIYVGSPAALHPRHTLDALAGGKHVLVEKPIAANARDARMLADAVAGQPLVVMEAAHWRYHPLVSLLERHLDGIGPLHHVAGRFDLRTGHIPRSDIRWDLSLGGGGLMDLGVYPVMWLLFVVGDQPRVVAAQASEPVPGIDGTMGVDVVWDGGVTGRIDCSMEAPDVDVTRSLEVVGERGRILIDNALAPQHGCTFLVETEEGTLEVPVPTTTTYEHQLAAFRDAILAGSSFPTTIEASVRTMQVIDDAYEAAGLGARPSPAR